jgi:tetratricopeptide (TPR) repeat protein
MSEGTLRPSLTERFVDEALARFPDEPRFVLSRAIATDQRTAASAGVPTSSHIDLLTEQYGAAIAFPQTAAEARIRLAWALYRTGKYEAALEHVSAAATQPINDPALQYLQQLILGHALWALERHEPAIAAFRQANAINPTAQSARVALMNALVLRGDREEAETLAQRVQTEKTADMDPWWMYWQGQYRMHAQVMARLREMSR